MNPGSWSTPEAKNAFISRTVFHPACRFHSHVDQKSADFRKNASNILEVLGTFIMYRVLRTPILYFLFLLSIPFKTCKMFKYNDGILPTLPNWDFKSNAEKYEEMENFS